MYGLGLAVPTSIPGMPADHASNMAATGFNYCGSKYGFQQMLLDLGYYSGAIDGAIGPKSNAAAREFAQENGVLWQGVPSNEFCQKLMDVWEARMGGGPPDPAPAPATSTRTRLVSKYSPLARRVVWQGAKPATTTPTGTPAQTDNGQPAAKAEAEPKGIIDKAMAWWNGQSTGTKVAIGVGGAAVVGTIIYLLAAGGGETAKATPNRRRQRRYASNRGRPKRRARLAREAAQRERARKEPKVADTLKGRKKIGKIITLKGGQKYGNQTIPAEYWRLGARRESDFADPVHLKYPVVFRDYPSGKIDLKQTRAHIASAKGYFKKWKHRYPPKLRKTIARNINRASRKYGGGPTVVTP